MFSLSLGWSTYIWSGYIGDIQNGLDKDQNVIALFDWSMLRDHTTSVDVWHYVQIRSIDIVGGSPDNPTVLLKVWNPNTSMEEDYEVTLWVFKRAIYDWWFVR